MDLEVTIEGVSDVRAANEIKRKVRQACKGAEPGGEWTVAVSPSETRGQWDLGIRGPSGLHFASFTELAQLPELVADQLRACRASAPMLNTRRWMHVVGVAALTSVLCASAGFAQPPVNRHAAALADFTKRVTAYFDLTKRATEGLPPLKRTDDPSEIALREVALGDAIRAGRTGARPGDILTPDVARTFRRIIKRDFRQRSRAGQKVMRDDIPHFRPKVNQTYPSMWPLATFPVTLLAALPPLPVGLEYRLLSDALILRDARANIVVDFTLDVF